MAYSPAALHLGFLQSPPSQSPPAVLINQMSGVSHFHSSSLSLPLFPPPRDPFQAVEKNLIMSIMATCRPQQILSTSPPLRRTNNAPSRTWPDNPHHTTSLLPSPAPHLQPPPNWFKLNNVHHASVLDQMNVLHDKSPATPGLLSSPLLPQGAGAP
jgi:hypothetical protein